MAKKIIDGYKRYYEKDTGIKPTLTLSLSDLSVVEKVSASVNELSESISRNLGVSEYANLLRKRSRAKSFGNIGDESKINGSYMYDLVDLCDFSSKLSGKPANSAAFLTVLSSSCPEIPLLTAPYAISLYTVSSKS